MNIQSVKDEERYNKNKAAFYNMVIKINSMEQLNKEGWKIETKNKDNNLDDLKKEVAVISVLGNKNSGKSFILHLLTGKDIPNGYSVTTEGLSLITPDNDKNKNYNYILIDTAGTESPLLKENDQKFTTDNINKMAKDRQITDYFIQKFILENSDIFICVVDNLTLTDQKFISRIIKNYTNKTIYIIHNLKTFIKKEQVENYIKETLTQSITFELEPDTYFNFNATKEDLENENQIYFKQILKQNNVNDEESSENRIIIHLIIANKDSPAGKYYNGSTIKYLNKQLLQVKEKRNFNVVESLKTFLITVSGEIFNKKLDSGSITTDKNAIKIKNNDNEENNINDNEIIENDEKEKNQDNIIFQNNNQLDLKDCSLDELGNSIIIDTQFKPKYRCGYFLDSKNIKKFFMEIELFGQWKITQEIKIGDDSFFIIHIEGKKEKEIIRKEEEYITKNYLPSNNFTLEVKIDKCKGIVKDNPVAEIDNGLYILVYSLMETHIEEQVVSAESEEEDD